MATYTKLRDGSWGVRLDTERSKGDTDTVTVTKRSGETKTERITVLWSGKGISLCKIIKSGGGRRNAYGQHTSRYSSGSRNRGGSFGEDEGSSYPCHVCGTFCFSGEHGYCRKRR